MARLIVRTVARGLHHRIINNGVHEVLSANDDSSNEGKD